MKKSKGMALIVAMVIVLIVSIVAVAILTTATVNKQASVSTYDTASSFANSQAGINLGEVVLLTASSSELKDLPGFDEHRGDAIANVVSGDCDSYLNRSIQTPSKCFWWIGSGYNGVISSSPADDFEDFVEVIKGEPYYDFTNAATLFKLEQRKETRTKSLENGDNLGKQFYRVTSIGKGNTNGTAKIQGQIGVFSELDNTINVDKSADDASDTSDE